MRPEDYQPMLTRWGHTWRALLAVAVSLLAWAPRIGYQLDTHPTWFCVDLLLGLMTFGVVMVWRRSHPVAVATAANLISTVSMASAGPAVLALVSLSTRRRWREIVPQVALTLLSATVSERLLRTPDEPPVDTIDTAMLVVLVLLVVAWGMYVGSRRELLASWQARARLAEKEQHALALQAQAAERARIAREMHDVLAHRISTLGMHAGALAYRGDLPPEQVWETAKTMQEMSNQALRELREVLGVLREGPGDAAPEEPQATAADLRELIDDNRRAGMRIDADVDVDVSAVPDATGRTLYRSLQEGLTNARKHAPASRVRVSVSGGPGDGLLLRVSNPLSVAATAPPESGFGLVGLAERVELHGGRQSSGIADDEVFELEVWLPWHG